MIELCQPPVNESQSPVLVVDHHVVRLDVSVHNAHAVAVVQCAQQFIEIAFKFNDAIEIAFKERRVEEDNSLQQKNLTSDVVVCESLVELLEVCVVDVLKYQSWCPAHRVLWLKFEKSTLNSGLV